MQVLALKCGSIIFRCHH